MIDTSLIPNIELFIAQVSPFCYLPQTLITQMAGNIEIRYIPKGETIVSENETDNYFLYIIRMGAVEQVNKNGELRARLENGDIFGFSIFNREDDEKYSAYAIENSLIYQLSYELLNALLKQYPEYVAYFSGDTGTRLHNAAKNGPLKEQDDIFIKTVAEVANPKVALIDAGATIRQAAQKMCEQRRSSVLIMRNDELIGIVNDRDMTKKVVAQGIDVQAPVTDIMTPNPPVIEAKDLVLNAVSLMMQNNIRNLPVMADGKIQGILTATDLVRQNSIQSVFIINHIFQADSLPLLIELSKQQRSVFAALIESGAYYNNVMKVMTLIADAFAQKLLIMAEHRFGAPPCRYAWMVSGSQARYEIHLLSDQDHAVVTERELTEPEREYFACLARFVSDGLHQCGYEYCSGGYMAGNPRWCQSLSRWKQYFDEWITQPEQEALLNASVLMDMRAIHGDTGLVARLHDYLVDLTRNNRRFLAFLTANSIRVKPPLSIFRNFVLTKEGENKRLNLKKRAISLLVDLGRIYALAAGIARTMSTEERFKACHKNGFINKATLDNALGAYKFVCDMRFKYQRVSLQNRKSLSNYISPDELTSFERNHLKDAFRLIAKFQEAAEMRFSHRGLMR